ncbi:DNA-dependent protein kinase catalytic subunit-like [Condylostylus longicornis]|uniref:DNA-dependent protein kinase catalytic subunit-like n=1 Tax=Condylostylus longicornis TaxID=2530218 RepID=UPI00244DB249|nr:DNA-dependent protein kinase catalytic subunit-like [Condylostylus longicornis]
MSSKFLSVIGLKECIGRGNPLEAKEILENISKFFDDRLSKAELELALETIFDTDCGTIAFLNRSIKEKKKFAECNANIFCIWIKILQNHGFSISFENYVADIIQCSTRFIVSMQVSAKEKEKATVVLQEIFQNRLADDLNASELISKLIDVLNLKNRPGNFSQQIFILLGIISRDTPENISERQAYMIQNNMLKTLEDTLLNEETVQYNVLAGAMEGLNLFLINFAPSPTESYNICDSIYVCVKKLSNPPLYVKAKAPFRHALDLFTRHYHLFSKQIYRDFKYWHECLTNTSWLLSTIYDDRRKAIFAIQSFHKAVEYNLNKKELNENDQKILLFLMTSFRSTLESNESKSYENRIAIRGFGVMAKLCTHFLPEMVYTILALVIQKTELISLAEDNELRDSLEHFPDYVEALSQIIKEVGSKDKNITPILAHTVQTILVRLIKDFHYLSKAHTSLATSAICKTLFNLSELDGSLFNDVLEKIILQGIIWTCSHKLVHDANLDWDNGVDWKDNITYKSYLELWRNLLDETSCSNYDKLFISNQIFNTLISNLLVILEKLNLKTKKRMFIGENGEDQEFFFCDPNIDLCPENSEDFRIFFNLVDFYRDIFFTKYNKEYFYKWINEYCTKMVGYIIENPLISGFLKFLQFGLTIADDLNYFCLTKESENESLKNSLLFLLKSIIFRCQKVSGELQFSCLELILKFPHEFYRDNIKDLIVVFKISFELGKTTIWLAKLGITALEKISEKFGEESYLLDDLNKFYEEVLPQLDSYLQGKGFEERHISAESYAYKNKKKIKKSTYFQRIESTELFEVQKRIYGFLGKLQPHQALAILDKNVINEDLVKWEIEQNIKLNLYYQNIRLEIYLDTIIPRICHLACTSIDRKTKIAACELVHAITLYLLGAKIHKGMLWQELCSKILLLGADNDVTIQQIFEPLLRQLMHFLSKYENLNKGVDVMMKILMDGISNENNCAVRDLSAVCIREFVEWSIKQTTPQQLAASPVSVEIILNELKMYSFDSNSSRRIGSALAFNNLYRTLREEESICDIYFIDLLHTFCVNFKLSEELSSIPLGSINWELEQVSLSLDHVVRVLKERSYLYTKPNRARKIPSAIAKSGEITLKDVVIYLLAESENKLMRYRRKCLEMVLSLFTSVENASSLSNFFSNYISLDIIFSICEGSLNAKLTLRSLKKTETERPYFAIYNWMQRFLGSLDCYIWLLSNNAFKNPKEIFVNAKIFEAIFYYFEKVCWSTVFDLIECLNSESIESSSNLRSVELEEINQINVIKCIIEGQIMAFIIAILNCGCHDQIPKTFWELEKGKLVKKFICDILYEPSILGFEIKYREITKGYQDKVSRMVKNIQTHGMNKEFYASAIQQIALNLIDNIKVLTEKTKELLYSNQISDYKWNVSKGVVFVLKNIAVNEVLDLTKLKDYGEKLLLHLFDGISENIFNKGTTINLTPNVKKFANQLLKVFFAIGEILNLQNTENLLKMFVRHLLNDKFLIMRGTLKRIKHGEYFFSIYKRAILENCKANFIKILIPLLFSCSENSDSHFVIKILIEIIDFCFKHRQHDQNTLQALVEINLKYFIKVQQILPTCEEQSLVVDYLYNLGLACPITWKLNSFKSKQIEIENYVIERLKDKKNSLAQKTRVFRLIPLLIGTEDFEHLKLTEALQDLQSCHFPLRSSEFRKNSVEETDLKVAFKSLLDALIVSKSFVILDFILQATAVDKKHVAEYMIRQDLVVYNNNLNSSQQVLVLERLFAKCYNEQLEPQIRVTILERFLVPILQNSREEIVIAFYIKSFSKISQLIDAKFGFAKQGWAVEQALVNRIIGFSLLEIFFGKLSKEKYYYPDCPLISAFLPNEKLPNIFIGTISKKSFYARTEVFVTDDKSTKEFFRQYQCAAYKALCSIICNTQTDMRFYLKFLFEEIPQKNEFIWVKLIDCSDDKIYIHDSQEMESYAKTKERFVSIRRLNALNLNINSSTNQATFARYLQSQNVFSSSLSQEISKIDLNYSMVRGDAEAFKRKESMMNEVFSVKLEGTEINKHEIMPTLCGVIQHMQESGVTPFISDPSKIKRSYPWVVSIANGIDAFSNHKNIRIFLAQVVDNCRNVFEPYAHILFKPILQLIFDECAGTQLNFFITDMIALLLCWTKKELYKPTTIEEIRLSSSLLQFLMKNTWNESKHIFKYNLELVQTMISLWKNDLEIPHRFLLDMIQVSERRDSKENELGLVLSGVILANNLVPWIERTKKIFIQKVFSNLDNDYSAIYQAAAHVYGMILKVLNSNQNLEILETVTKELVGKLKGIANKRESKTEKYFKDILYGVHKSYPEILDYFKETISYKIPSAIGNIKKLYLEMLLARLEAYNSDEIYNIIISIGIKDLLKIDEYQLLALHIINKSLPNLQGSEIHNLFSAIEICIESSKAESRDVAYEILIYISQNMTNISGLETGTSKNALEKKISALLLKGLLDTDLEIQKRIFHFWSQETNLSQNMSDRLLFLISNYSADSEKQFLSFCTQLILEPAIQNFESKQQIFQFETDRDSKLEEYQINTNFRFKNTFSVPPLFADSQSRLFSQRNYNFVRDIPNEYFFEPTKSPLELSQIRTQFSLPSQTSLPFIVQPYVLDRRSQRISVLENENQLRSAETYDNFLRKRFLKDRNKEKTEITLKIIDKKTKKQHISSADKVTLYRRYRIGNYPDLLINTLAFLLPLQGIVKWDRCIARQIFVSIFTSLVKVLGPECNQFVTSVGYKIQNILNGSRNCDPVVFSTFLEMALLKAEEFNFKPETVSTIAKACNMQTIGAIYLENRINIDFEESESGPSTKSGSIITNCERHWLELSEIYNSLAEYDIVTAIFTHKVDADPRLGEAIELKTAGRYKEAQELLLKIIERRQLVEQNFSYNSFYECFEELGDWSMLSKAIQQQLDDFDELWTDDFNTNYYLPKLIKAELQLILKSESHSTEFLEILQNWMKSDEVKANHIKQVFCEELMMLQIANANYRQARVHCEDYLKKFLLHWGVMSSHYDKLRHENILNSQKVAEIDYYASLLLEQFDEKVIDLLKNKWDGCKIDKSDSLRYWNCVLGYRAYVADLFIVNLENLSSESNLADGLQRSINKLVFQLFDAAIYQKNYGIVNEIIKGLKNKKQKYIFLECEISELKAKLLQTENASLSNSIDILHQAWEQTHDILKSDNIKENVKLKTQALQVKSEISEEFFKKLPFVKNLDHKVMEKILRYVTHSMHDDVKYKIFEESLWSLKYSTEIAQNLYNEEFDKRSSNQKFCADAYYHLAEFCYRYYQISEEKIALELEKNLISSIFAAMYYNSYDSRQLFPFLLQLPSLENGLLADLFTENSNKVPDWMFLNWIPQILSRLNFTNPSYIDLIVYRIARSYPNALIYQFYTWVDEQKSLIKDFITIRSELAEISYLLKNPLVDCFIRAIKSVRYPHLQLTFWITKLLEKLPQNQESYLNNFTELMAVFNLDDSFHGSVHREIMPYKKEFEDLKCRNILEDSTQIYNEMNALKAKILNSTKRTDKYFRLEHFCPWLSSFQWCGEEICVELPGQYDGEQRPIIEQNAKIVKFGERVEVFQSMRKPVRLNVFGTDAKTHDFLVKFGEDLQQDHRIQQTLNVMSNKLKNDLQCQNHNLFIRTYKVIPLEKSGGMISFIFNTTTIDDLISECLMRRNSSGKQLLHKSIKDFVTFIKEPTKRNPHTKDLDVYGAAVTTYTRDQIISNFRKVQYNISIDVIKYSLVDMAVSPESFYILRNNFAKSLASMSISHWILGVGDRHLQNILISTKDGTLSGIDFGIVLDGGIRNLVIPELMPFRLTPQFINVLSPMGTEGLLFKCMSHILRVYRSSAQSLLACVDIFARNPTLDWIALQSIVKLDWKPLDGIRTLRRKLLGDNPMHISRENLEDSAIAKYQPVYKEGYKKLLEGNYQFNIRSRLPEKDLTVEDQVKCLIDMATDPAILGCSYVGWHPWL